MAGRPSASPIQSLFQPAVVRIPIGLDWLELRNRYPPEFTFNQDVAALLIDTILWKQQADNPNQFTNLKGEYLRECHWCYAKYMEWLQNARVIDSDNRFVVGEKSKGYRLAQPYQSQETCIYLLTKKATINAFHRRNALGSGSLVDALRTSPMAFLWDADHPKPHQIPSSILTNPHSDPLTYPFSSFALLYPPRFSNPLIHSRFLSHWYKYDAGFSRTVAAPYPDCWEGMRHLYATLRRATLGEGWQELLNHSAAKRQWSPKHTEQWRRKLLATKHALKERQFRFTRNSTNGRLDTTLTNMPKEFRPLLRLDGCPDLLELDIRTAQPYLALRLLHERDADPAVIEEWAAAVCGSDLYSTLAAELAVSRDEAKVCWFRLLFAHNRASSPPKTAFENRFPEVAEVFRNEKRHHNRNLAIRLQTFESHVVLEHIVPRLAALDIPVLTIHDCVIVPTGKASIAERVVSQELLSFVGYAPVIHIKRLTS